MTLIGIHILAGRLTWTGDEPRYTYQGLGLYTHWAFYPTRAVWDHFLQRNSYSPNLAPYMGKITRPFNTLFPSAVYGPFLMLFGLEAARWLNFAMGCVGIAGLYFLLRRLSLEERHQTHWPVILSIMAISLSLPLLAYLKLLYPETLLFVVVSFALYSLLAGNRYLTSTLVILLPFVHVRALPLAVTFFIVMLVDMGRGGATGWSKVTISGLCIGGLGIFTAVQFALFGTFTTGAFSVYPPSASIFLERLGMQLYDVRHGVLAYSPVFLVGFSGLFLGVIRRNWACLYSTALLLSYVLTFVWATAAESWTARYWVAGLPFIAVGIWYWLGSSSGKLSYLPIISLTVINLISLAAFIHQPNWFLDSRRTSVTYAHLFSMIHVHLGLVLPVDADPGGLPPYTRTIPGLLGGTALALSLVALCNIVRGRQLQRYTRLLTCALLFSPIILSVANVIPPTAYRIVSGHESAVRVEMLPAAHVTAIQFDSKLGLYWGTPEYSREFRIKCVNRGRVLSENVQPSRPLVMLPYCPRAAEIDIEAEPRGSGRDFYKHIGSVTLIRSLFAE